MRPKKKILCVDNDEQYLSELSFKLRTRGFNVLTASSGAEAINIFTGTHVDMVLAAFAMPEMDGKQLVERLKAIATYVPMVLIGDIYQLNRDGYIADAALQKGVQAAELLECIKAMVVRKRGPRKGSQEALRCGQHSKREQAA